MSADAAGTATSGELHVFNHGDDSGDQLSDVQRCDEHRGDDYVDDGPALQLAGGVWDDGELWDGVDVERDARDVAHGDVVRADGGHAV